MEESLEKGLRVVVVGKQRMVLYCFFLAMHRPPMLGLQKVHIHLGQIKKQQQQKRKHLFPISAFS